jgi:hypothetical protein
MRPAMVMPKFYDDYTHPTMLNHVKDTRKNLLFSIDTTIVKKKNKILEAIKYHIVSPVYRSTSERKFGKMKTYTPVLSKSSSPYAKGKIVQIRNQHKDVTDFTKMSIAGKKLHGYHLPYNAKPKSPKKWTGVHLTKEIHSPNHNALIIKRKIALDYLKRTAGNLKDFFKEISLKTESIKLIPVKPPLKKSTFAQDIGTFEDYVSEFNKKINIAKKNCEEVKVTSEEINKIGFKKIGKKQHPTRKTENIRQNLITTINSA